ncbi:MAG: helix-turn-helix domain-containing protein [Acidobacteriota bacterium]|nr:helix-turn-helix domain-containing protein [Acidobacteriota bacterium]
MGSSKRLDKHSPRCLGEKLRRIRESFGDSQAEFLEKLGNPDSILQGSISGYERGQREPPLLILLQYAKVANVFLEVLVDDSLDLPIEIPSKEKSLG